MASHNETSVSEVSSASSDFSACSTRAELGLLRGRDQGGRKCVRVEDGSPSTPREGGKGGMGGLGWVRGDREWEIEDGVGG